LAGRQLLRLRKVNPMTITHIRASAVSERLSRALLDAASRGVRPRCGDYETSYMWLSEDPAERAQAAPMCSGCPILQPCTEVVGINASACGLDAIEP
jgi:hypothetical protein